VVGNVPLLGSGKTDYVGATRLAKELATPAEPVRQQEAVQQEVA
jgi:acyl-[acyl-carrier-protein]-phospholipid O-acyltransferase/long-chain-fatty-acid--[acyl-carrier-protein] ligase